MDARRMVVALWLSLLAGQTALAAEDGSADRRAGSGSRAALTLAIAPFLDPVLLESRYGQYAAWLREQTGIPIRFQTSSSFEQFARRIDDDAWDIVWINHYQVPAALEHGYKVMLRARREVSAIFLSRRDRASSRLQEAPRGVIGTPPAQSIVSHLVAEHLETLPGAEHLTLRHFAGHETCLAALVAGKVGICATYREGLDLYRDQLPPDVPLWVIDETRGVRSPVIVVHESVDKADRQRVAAAFARLSRSREGRTLLDTTGLAAGFEFCPDVSDGNLPRNPIDDELSGGGR